MNATSTFLPSELAVIRARPVGNDLAFDYALSLQHNRLLVNAGVLVRALELGELINIATNFTRKLTRMVLAFNSNDDPLRVNRINDSIAARKDYRP